MNDTKKLKPVIVLSTETPASARADQQTTIVLYRPKERTILLAKGTSALMGSAVNG